jgi:hypothetical protein
LAELVERDDRLILGYRPSSRGEFLLAPIHPPLWSPSPVLQDKIKNDKNSPKHMWLTTSGVDPGLKNQVLGGSL